MKKTNRAGVACAVLAGILAFPGMALAQSERPSGASGADGVPIVQLIETVSKKTNKSFIVDPRVTGNATLVGIDPAKITYPQLLAVLQVHGFAAIENGGLTRVIPDTSSRTSATPLISGNDKHEDAEYVTRVVKVKSIPAAQLVPILRSLLPQNAHLAAFICTNELIVVDTYANVKRIESVVAAMDKDDPLTLEKCPARFPEVRPAAAEPPK
jgi:type II secretory pathway component GspD/PulD (secretin)